jgi:alpha-beta hydrolase superfamily lysophospholipase
MSERASAFGSHGGLVGVVCEPDAGPEPGAPAVLLFNVGLNHRVGPGRLNVDLARSLARSGYASLRFDLSGLGDSEPRGGASSDAERSVVDLREAMDFLQRRRGIEAFVVVGLCSGVDGAHAAALADPRVRGAVFIDGYAYPTPGYHVLRGARKARGYLDPSYWRRWIGWKARRLRGLSPDVDVETGSREPIFDRTYPPLKAFRDDLQALLERQVRMLFLYTVDAWFFNHRSQFAPMIGRRALPGGIEVEYWTDADHVFRAVPARRRLVQRLTAWMEASFPTAAADEARRRSAS